MESETKNYGKPNPFPAVLVLLTKGDQVYLAEKREKIGAGFWNGYGGGIEEGETPEDAAVRELMEESGVTVLKADLRKAALLTFRNALEDGTFFTVRVHVFVADAWQGEPREVEGGKMGPPSLFDRTALPTENMMPSDGEWMPLVLQGYALRAAYVQTKGRELVDSQLELTGVLDDFLA